MSVAVDFPVRRLDRRAAFRPAPGPSGRPAVRRPGRLTARGRAAVVVGGLVALIAVPALARGVTSLVDSAFWPSSAISAPPAAGRPPAVRTVVVRPSDTLWQIAVRVAPAVDPRRTVAALARANRIPDDRVTPGQLLVVPSG